jgi:hypothetical protein
MEIHMPCPAGRHGPVADERAARWLRDTVPDRLDARLPIRWLQGETGKILASIIPVASG